MHHDEGLLILEDGSLYSGRRIGTWQTRLGEVVFNTSMTGYQEILTDPSYAEQIIVMTYPLIGNYGISAESAESTRIHANGLIISENCHSPSHWQSFAALHDYLEQHNVPGLSGVDTRALTRRLRTQGTMRGFFADSPSDYVLWKQDLLDHHSSKDITEKVASTRPYCAKDSGSWRVAVVDFGAKAGIVRSLAALDAEVWVYPGVSPLTDILACHPDAVVLSNGPGNPEDCSTGVELARQLVTRLPIMGICLGHQLLGLALNGTTYRLKFGHRGGNHPVKDLQTGRAFITAQNHGYALAASSNADFAITHANINDGSVEGIRHKELPAFSVQFHPEASPGPNDALGLFKQLQELAEVGVQHA